MDTKEVRIKQAEEKIIKLNGNKGTPEEAREFLKRKIKIPGLGTCEMLDLVESDCIVACGFGSHSQEKEKVQAEAEAQVTASETVDFFDRYAEKAGFEKLDGGQKETPADKAAIAIAYLAKAIQAINAGAPVTHFEMNKKLHFWSKGENGEPDCYNGIHSLWLSWEADEE
jgi:hypothetical protein